MSYEPRVLLTQLVDYNQTYHLILRFENQLLQAMTKWTKRGQVMREK